MGRVDWRRLFQLRLQALKAGGELGGLGGVGAGEVVLFPGAEPKGSWVDY